MKEIVVALGLALTLSSCTQRLFDFTIVSSKNVDLSKANTFTRGYNRTEGKDVAHIVLFFPTGKPNIKEAVDRAIEKIPGCVALLDGVVKSYGFYIPMIYGQTAYIIEGTPLIDPSFGGGKLSKYNKIELNKKGEVKQITALSEAEYLDIKNSFAKR